MYAIYAYIRVVPGGSMGRQSYGSPIGRVWVLLKQQGTSVSDW